jgi:hypothetical protein
LAAPLEPQSADPVDTNADPRRMMASALLVAIRDVLSDMFPPLP